MSQTKFFYIRDKWSRLIFHNNKDGNNMEEPRIVRGNPIACIAYERHTDPDVVGCDYVLFSLSICNPKDTFNKTEGRKLAVDKLTADGSISEGFVIEEDAPSTEVIRVILECIADSRLPRRVRESAQDWLDRKQRNQEVD